MCGNELRMVPIRVDGRPADDGRAGPPSEAAAGHGLVERVRDAARSRITMTELALLVVLGGLTASLSVAVLT